MVRAPFQVLVIPYRPTPAGDWEFAVCYRSDIGCWQGIAGGGEDDETPLEAARREAFEEAGFSPDAPFLLLDTTASIPVTCFREGYRWGDDRFVVPEHAFGVLTGMDEITLSVEHTEVRWRPYTSYVGRTTC